MVSRALLAACLSAFLVAAPGAAHPDEARLCQVAEIEGSEARSWTAGEWAALRAGQAVAFEAKIATGSATRVRITCDDGVVVTVGTSTEINLESLVSPGPSVVLQLIDGIVGLLVPDAGPGFDVRTPLAIASVRSTEWLVEHGRADGSAVFVRAGRVAVRPRDGGAVTLGPGEGVTVTPEGVAGEVKTWGAERIARSTAALGFGWQ